MGDIAITELTTEEIPGLAALLSEQTRDYMCGFYPFAFDQETLSRQIQNAALDRYWVLVWQNELAGFFMLRGMDAGYERPSFGVFVAEKYSGHGLAKAALVYAVSWCRENNVDEIMLKVETTNTRAVAIYRKAGFYKTGQCPDTGQDIMVCRLT